MLRPGGRVALAVWDEASANPWATIPGRALVELGHTAPPDPNAPGMFALAAPGALAELLEEAGFVDVVVEAVDVPREYASLDSLHRRAARPLGRCSSRIFRELSEDEQAKVRRRIGELASPSSRPPTGRSGCPDARLSRPQTRERDLALWEQGCSAFQRRGFGRKLRRMRHANHPPASGRRDPGVSRPPPPPTSPTSSRPASRCRRSPPPTA